MCFMGDINIDWNQMANKNYQLRRYADKLNQWLTKTNLLQLVGEIARKRLVKKKTGVKMQTSIIDHVNVNFLHDKINKIEKSDSDHAMIVLGLDLNEETTRGVKIYQEKLDWKAYSPEELRKVLLEEDWSCINQTSNVDDMSLHLEQIMNRTLNRIVPVKLVRKKENVTGSEISRKMRRLIQKRNQLLQRWKTNKTNVIYMMRRRKNSKISHSLKEDKKNSIQNTLKHNDSKTLWNAVNRELRRKDRTMVTRININGDEIIEEGETTNKFAEFFREKY